MPPLTDRDLVGRRAAGGPAPSGELVTVAGGQLIPRPTRRMLRDRAGPRIWRAGLRPGVRRAPLAFDGRASRARGCGARIARGEPLQLAADPGAEETRGGRDGVPGDARRRDHPREGEKSQSTTTRKPTPRSARLYGALAQAIDDPRRDPPGRRSCWWCIDRRSHEEPPRSSGAGGTIAWRVHEARHRQPTSLVRTDRTIADALRDRRPIVSRPPKPGRFTSRPLLAFARACADGRRD